VGSNPWGTENNKKGTVRQLRKLDRIKSGAPGGSKKNSLNIKWVQRRSMYPGKVISKGGQEKLAKTGTGVLPGAPGGRVYLREERIGKF